MGDFDLDLITRELSRNGSTQTLAPQTFQILQLLALRSGQLVTREELANKLWPAGIFVDKEQGLKKAVKRLREALGDSAENPQYIETLPRQGFRFIAEVHYDPLLGIQGPTAPAISVPGSARKHKTHRSRYFLATIASGALCLAAYLLFLNLKLHPSPIQAVAVLPLDNLSGDPSQDSLTEGLTDEIITDLARIGDVRVISRASVMRYRGAHNQVSQIARELNVDALVEGSYERNGDSLRLRVQLIRSATQQTIWAEAYNRKAVDLFQLESDVARDIAFHVLQHSRRIPGQALANSHPVNPQAFQDYLRGRHYWALRTKDGLEKAVTYFQAAIEKDPLDARSYAALAHCYLSMPFLTEMPASEAFAKARKQTEQALALEPSLGEAHLANATILMYNDWNFQGAEREFQRALEFNPNDATAHQWHGALLTLIGRNDEAIREEKLAADLDPLSAVVHHEMADVLRNAGHYDEALLAYQETLRIDSHFFPAYWEMASTLRRQGKLQESIHFLQRGAEDIVREYKLDPAVVLEIDKLSSAYAHSGPSGYFRQALKFHGYMARPAYYLARDYADLGDREAAFAELRRAIENHDLEALWMFTDPELESLHGDPRYRELIRTIGFPVT